MRKPIGKYTCLILRISAVLLIFFMGLHILVQHFSLSVDFEPQETRMALVFLLVIAILYGFTCTSRIILDFKNYSTLFEEILTVVLLILGIIFAVIGLIILPGLIWNPR